MLYNVPEKGNPSLRGALADVASGGLWLQRWLSAWLSRRHDTPASRYGVSPSAADIESALYPNDPLPAPAAARGPTGFLSCASLRQGSFGEARVDGITPSLASWWAGAWACLRAPLSCNLSAAAVCFLRTFAWFVSAAIFGGLFRTNLYQEGRRLFVTVCDAQNEAPPQGGRKGEGE